MYKGSVFLNARQLQYAIELSKCLNFSQVANNLGITQPALSKQIMHLEKELGVKLFDRTTQPLSLTAAGEHFFKEAENILYKEERLIKTMEEFKTGERGKVVIGISPFRSLYLMPSIAKKIKEKFPKVTIILHEASSDILRKEAMEAKYDFAVVNLPVDESVLEVTPIEPDKLVLAVPSILQEKITVKDNVVDFKDCKKLPFIVVGQTQEMRILFDKLCASSDIKPNIAMEVVGVNTAYAMTKAGIGATLLPLQFVKDAVLDDNVLLYNIKNITQARKPAIIRRRGQYLSKYAKYAIELLTK